jgi:diketogulonate reductase-like aldo/keto reductase
LSDADFAVWKEMAALHRAGKARAIGVSNVSLGQLRMLLEAETLPPSFVQNRCFAVSYWDRDVRALCAERGMVYQGFSLLTANAQLLGGPEMVAMARRHGKTIAQLVFRFAQQVGMLPLTGTTDVGHMREDLASSSFQLTEDEVGVIESIAVP